MDLLFSLAVWTTLIQGALLPVLLVLSARWIITSSAQPAKKARAKRANSAPADADPLVRLAPLHCGQCGAGLILGSGQLTCAHCGTTTEEPPEYAAVFDLRRRAMCSLHQASIYLTRASRLSSPWVKGALLLLGLWFCAVPIIMMIAGGMNKRYDPLFEKLGNGAIFLLLSLGLWILVFFFTAMMVTRVRRIVPTISDWSQLAQSEEAQCPNCGGNMLFGKGDLSTLCGYCGVETLRMNVVLQARHAAAADVDRTGTSILTAKHACDQAIDDLVGTPAIIVFIFLFLPAIVLSPYLLYQLSLTYPGPVVGGVIATIALGWGIWTVRKRRPNEL